MDKTTQLLFGSFPREVGETRKIAKSLEEFEKFILKGEYHTSLYKSDLTIDKVWVDVDAPSVEESQVLAKAIIQKVRKLNLPYIPVFSGRRGFHIYTLFKPFHPTNQPMAAYVVKSIQAFLTNGVEYIDQTIIGNVRHLVRIPNTPRSGCYCVYLPYEFEEWDAVKVVEWARKRRFVDYDLKELPDIRQFVDVQQVYEENDKKLEFPDFGKHEALVGVEYLKFIIRPCLYDFLRKDNKPPHIIRTELVAELQWLGYSPEKILEVIEDLGWSNYSRKISQYHIKKIHEKRLMPMSCRNLKNVVRCTNCGWNYFWGG